MSGAGSGFAESVPWVGEMPAGCNGYVQGSDFEPPYIDHDGLCPVHPERLIIHDEEPF